MYNNMRAWISSLGSLEKQNPQGVCGAPQVALVIKNLPANAGDARDLGSIPGPRSSPGVGNGNPLQYSCLGNSMDIGAWWAAVLGITKS